MRHRLALLIALTAVYALTLASAHPLDLALGALLGAVLIALTGERLRTIGVGEPPPLHRRLAWFPVFAGAVFADVARGTFDVALRTLHLRPLRRPGLVRIPIGPRSERGVAVTALTTTLSPGAVLVDVDWERGDLVLHVIDASDPDEVRDRHQRFYDRYQRMVFP